MVTFSRIVPTVYVSLFSFVMVLNSSCRSPAPADGSLSAFRDTKVLQENSVATRLMAIESNPVFHTIVYQARLKTIDSAYGAQQGIQVLDVVFPALEPLQFAFLKSSYGGGRSQLVYQAGRSYLLSEFLPPFAKASLGKNFLLELKRNSASQTLDFLYANCWGTAYEFLRQADERFAVYLTADRQSIINEFINQGGGVYLPSEPSSPNNLAAKFGDVLLVFVDNELAHAAIWIDQGLWFEKTGNDSDFAYRLTTEMDWQSDAPQKTTYRTMRIVHPDRLRHPSTIFKSVRYDCKTDAIGAAGSLFYREFLVSFDALGIPQLGSDAYSPTMGEHVDYLKIPLTDGSPLKTLCKGQ